VELLFLGRGLVKKSTEKLWKRMNKKDEDSLKFLNILENTKR
jgi:hypothetical protein